MAQKHFPIITLTALLLCCSIVFPAAVRADNPPSADLVALGKAIFFDKNLSTPPGQSCASCHDPKTGFADPDRDLPVSKGVIENLVGSRNAPSVSYAAFCPTMRYDTTMRPGIMEPMYIGGFFWDGRAKTLEDQAKEPFLNILEMHNANPGQVIASVRASEYADLFKKVFGPDSLDDVEKAYQHTAEAIAAYERSPEVNPFNSKFDLFLDGKVGLSDTEARGYALFTGKANCFRCHEISNPDLPGVKPLFTNFGHQNLGTPANLESPFLNLPAEFNPDGKKYVDLGLGAVVKDPKENGKFKIPSLRNVAVTAPYEHNGVFKTVREVVVFNNTRDLPESNYPPSEVAENVHRHNPAEMHGAGNMAQPPAGHVKRMHGFTPMPGTLGQLGLNDAEVDDIVAFLGTLTDGYQLQ